MIQRPSCWHSLDVCARGYESIRDLLTFYHETMKARRKLHDRFLKEVKLIASRKTCAPVPRKRRIQYEDHKVEEHELDQMK